ncbi:unnamed protein product [Oikopleura dioica]|uniref:Uncharacterized protein n=1 Tax=Oikopleura dioica TaxID=34765 RepID=E4Z0N9_OIKDI|nr:unnamed protein product [Oikopleura dioica]
MNKLSSYQCYHNPGTPDNYYRAMISRIGGMFAIKGSHPHIAKLSYVGFGKAGHFCDGSIIHKRFILTAAHCFVGWDENASNYEVLVGAQESSTRTNDDKKAYSVKSIECHEEYKITERRVVNDICILKTNKDIEFNINVWPICLPDDLPPPNSEGHAGGNCYIGDWVDSRFYSIIGVPTLTPELCQESNNEYSLFVDADQHVCAGNEKEDQNTCQGKSGGPLVCDRNDLQRTLHHMAMNKNQKVLTGIQSFGVGCGQPRVYTNIHQFLPWIFEKLNKHDDCKPENPCRNGGICNSQDFHGHECECPAGWITEDCSLREKDLTACYKNSCISGKCILDDRYSWGYTCDCDYGYGGPFCNIVIDKCALINCFMGSCDLDSSFWAQCKCSSGWTGWHCSLKITP